VLKGHNRAISSLAFSPDGKRLASSGSGDRLDGDGVMRIWDIILGKELLTIKSGLRKVKSMSFSPDGKRLASVDGYTLRIWDVVTGQELLTFRGNYNGPITFSINGEWLALASRDNTVNLWRAATNQEVRVRGKQ
jgi:WD40 repeat protein